MEGQVDDPVAEAVARLALGVLDLHADHQPEAPDLADGGEALGQGREALAQLPAAADGVGAVLPHDELERRQGRGAGDRVAAERRGVAPAGPVHHRGPRDHRAQRQPVGDPLREADDVAGDAPVLGGEHLARAADAALDLVEDEQHAVLVAEPAQARQEVRRRDDVPALALDRLDEDRRQLFGRADGLQEGLDAVEVAVAGVVDLGDQRGEAAALQGLGTAERHGAVGPPVEGVHEGEGPVAACVPPGQLEGRLDRLGAGVGEEDALGLRAGSECREPLGQPDLRRVVEVRARHVDQASRLLADRRHDPRVRVSGVGDGDPGGVVEEPVAVHVLDHRPAGAPDHQRVRPRVRGRHDAIVALQPRGAPWARQRPDDPRFLSSQSDHLADLSQCSVFSVR